MFGDGEIPRVPRFTTPAASGDALVFTGGTGFVPTLSVNRSVASLTFGSSASSFVLGGTGIYTLTAAGGIVNNSVGNDQTIGNAGYGLTVTSGGNLAINSVIANNTGGTVGSFSTSLSNGNQMLSWTVVPERNLASLLLLGGSVPLRRRRDRR